MNNSKELKAGALLSYVQMGIGIIIGLVYTPVMIKLLGKNEYGLYNTVASTVSMLSVLSLGFNSGYIRFFAGYKKDNDSESIYQLNGLFIIIFTIIGLVALACGLFLTRNLSLVFDKGLTAEEYITAKKLMILMTAQLALSFPLSVFSNIIAANEKFVFLKALNIITSALSPLVTLPLLLMGYKSVALVTVGFVFLIITGCINIWFVRHKLGHRFIFRNPDKQVFKSLFGYTFFIAVNIIIDQINWKVDNMLLGRFCGTSSVAVYAVGSALNSYYLSFSTAISGVFTPKIHKIVADCKNSGEELKHRFSELFIKVGRIQFIVLALILSGLVFFGKPFIRFWVGDGYENSYWVALLLIAPVTAPLIQNIGIEMQRALDKHKFRSLLYLAMAVINVICTVILCPRYGEIGAAAGTAGSLIIANGIIMNIYYHKNCNIDILAFWKSIAKMLPALVLPIVFASVLNRLIDEYSNSLLLVSIIAYTAVYSVSMWLIGLNRYEKGLAISLIKKILPAKKCN